MDRYCFIGLDIGRFSFFASIVNESGQEIQSLSFSQTHCGYEQLIAQVNQLSSQGLTPIVSADGHLGNIAQLDEYLITEGIVFKPLHPTADRSTIC